MAVAARATNVAAPLADAARERLDRIDSDGPSGVLGDRYALLSSDLDVGRVDVEEVVSVGEHAVGLLTARGRLRSGEWVERRLSAVFAGEGDPQLHTSWVAGLDAASRSAL